MKSKCLSLCLAVAMLFFCGIIGFYGKDSVQLITVSGTGEKIETVKEFQEVFDGTLKKLSPSDSNTETAFLSEKSSEPEEEDGLYSVSLAVTTSSYSKMKSPSSYVSMKMEREMSTYLMEDSSLYDIKVVMTAFSSNTDSNLYMDSYHSTSIVMSGDFMIYMEGGECFFYFRDLLGIIEENSNEKVSIWETDPLTGISKIVESHTSSKTESHSFQIRASYSNKWMNMSYDLFAEFIAVDVMNREDLVDLSDIFDALLETEAVAPEETSINLNTTDLKDLMDGGIDNDLLQRLTETEIDLELNLTSLETPRVKYTSSFSKEQQIPQADSREYQTIETDSSVINQIVFKDINTTVINFNRNQEFKEIVSEEDFKKLFIYNEWEKEDYDG